MNIPRSVSEITVEPKSAQAETKRSSAFIGCGKLLYAIINSYTLSENEGATTVRCGSITLGPAYERPGAKTLDVIVVDRGRKMRTVYPDCRLASSIHPVAFGEKPHATIVAYDVLLTCSQPSRTEELTHA